VQTLTDELKKNKQPTIAIFSALQDKNRFILNGFDLEASR
jgi:hypothetical protein